MSNRNNKRVRERIIAKPGDPPNVKAADQFTIALHLFNRFVKATERIALIMQRTEERLNPKFSSDIAAAAAEVGKAPPDPSEKPKPTVNGQPDLFQQ